MAKKEKQAVWLYPEVKELLTTHMAAANAMSQSDFIEKAIRFYAGYLDCNSENMTEYLGETVSAVIDGIVKGSEQRISRALFKRIKALHVHHVGWIYQPYFMAEACILGSYRNL